MIINKMMAGDDDDDDALINIGWVFPNICVCLYV